MLGDAVLVDRRALRGPDIGDVGEVLDRDRQAGEQAALGRLLLHQRLGVIAGALEAQRRQRIDGAIDLADALFQHVEQVERRDVALLELADDRVGGLPHQFLASQWISPVGILFLTML